MPTGLIILTSLPRQAFSGLLRLVDVSHFDNESASSLHSFHNRLFQDRFECRTYCTLLLSLHHFYILSIADFYRLCQVRLSSLTLSPASFLKPSFTFTTAYSLHIIILQTSHREYAENIQRSYRKSREILQRIYRDFTDNRQTVYRDHTENLQKIQRESTHNIQTRYSDSQTPTNSHKACYKTSAISADNRLFRETSCIFTGG